MAFPADPLDVTVTIAFDGSTPVDVSAYVRVADGIERTYGRSGRVAQYADPGRVTFTLQTAGSGGEADVPSGTWNPFDPAGTYWQRAGWLGAPVVVTVEGETWFTGQLSRCSPWWDTDGAGYAEVEASGPLRWIVQKRPTRSPLERAIVDAGPALYLPLTEGAVASAIATPIAGLTPVDVVGLKFGQVEGPIGDPRSLPELARDDVGGDIAWRVSLSEVTGTSWTVDVMVRCKRVVDAFSDYPAFGWSAGSGATESYWILDLSWDGGPTDPDVLRLFGYEVNDTGYFTLDIDTELVMDGEWHHVRVQVKPNGGSTRADMTLYGVGGSVTAANTDTTVAPGGVSRVDLFSASTSDLQSGSLGHIAVYDSYSPDDVDPAAWGHWGESAIQRLSRLATQDGFTLDTTFGYYGAATLGPQPTAPLIDILRDAEGADLGRLTEQVDTFGLRYVTRDARYNVAPTFTIGIEHQGRSPQPEQKVGSTVGSITVSRPGGSSVIVTDAAALAAGGTDGSANPNVELDSSLVAIGQWLLSLQPAGSSGVNTLQLDLSLDGGALVGAWLAAMAAPPIRVLVEGITGQPRGLDEFVEGWSERLTDVDWTATLVISEAGPYDVFIREGDDNLGRREADASTLNGAVTSTATALSVATSSGALWTTELAHVPLDIDIEGERITVTDIVDRRHDRFDRVETNGWGTMNSGQAWTCTGGSASDYYTITE